MKKHLLLAALIAAPIAATFTAHAETVQPQQVLVSTYGLDLTNPADAAAMIGRIETALRPSCVLPNRAVGRTVAQCTRILTANAINTLRIGELNLAFQHRSGPIRPVALG